eukprot:TRINITY_DN3242_c0_g1_i3.p1 TRINITY_DN3242_c0_g1~~TRINITY_DN3242_c0_g1_i3.p1  ORF type:complete len:677 (+),score=185.82 TRINITY_DN3242_c0_g1_i3:131-2161(+)
MAEKYAGKLHLMKEEAKEKWGELKETGVKDSVAKNVDMLRSKVIRGMNAGEDYDHHYRRKTRKELLKISAAVMGIEFAYAAETAFVSPTLLKIGVSQSHMTLIWCLSPLVGFFLTPILGSLSDRCKSTLGRRRPFIILLSIGVVLGLLLVPNGKDLGKLMGDKYYERNTEPPVGRLTEDQTPDGWGDEEYEEAHLRGNLTTGSYPTPPPDLHTYHPWGIFFTIIGTVLLDFDADACQSPSRAYLLDVTLPEDHAIGLSTFTIMAGLGGSMGYAMGAIDWGLLGALFGGHVRFVFTVVLFIFIFCVLTTLTSFKEIPLDILTNPFKRKSVSGQSGVKYDAVPKDEFGQGVEGYGPIQLNITDTTSNPFTGTGNLHQNLTEKQANQMNGTNYLQATESSFSQASPYPVDDWNEEATTATVASFKQYLWSIIYMPASLRWLCLTNLFCWSSLVCYSLYFTDFVGQAVFGGDPRDPEGSPGRQLYNEGVRFACWGMSMYSLSCSCYSFMLDKMIKKFRAKPVYIGGQLVYSCGMVCLALTRSKWGVIVFSLTAGVMYSTLFTMPYLLVAHYHETDTIQCEDSWFLKQIRKMLSSIREGKSEDEKSKEAGVSEIPYSDQVRGIGTDIAIVSCMVFLAQFILSSLMGSIVACSGSTVAVVVCAAVLSFCGAVSANFVSYLDL